MAGSPERGLLWAALSTCPAGPAACASPCCRTLPRLPRRAVGRHLVVKFVDRQLEALGAAQVVENLSAPGHRDGSGSIWWVGGGEETQSRVRQGSAAGMQPKDTPAALRGGHYSLAGSLRVRVLQRLLGVGCRGIQRKERLAGSAGKLARQHGIRPAAAAAAASAVLLPPHSSWLPTHLHCQARPPQAGARGGKRRMQDPRAGRGAGRRRPPREPAGRQLRAC